MFHEVAEVGVPKAEKGIKNKSATLFGSPEYSGVDICMMLSLHMLFLMCCSIALSPLHFELQLAGGLISDDLRRP